MRINLNDAWHFTPTFVPELISLDFDLKGLERVRLPHTCVETPFNCFDEHLYQMEMGYVKVFYAPPAWKGKTVKLTFEGAAHFCEVFVNEKPVCSHAGGYTAFSCDIGPFLKFDCDNRLTVKLDSRESLNIPPFGHVVDYMTYGGLYREVYLDVLPEQYIERVFITTENLLTDHAELVLEVELSDLIDPVDAVVNLTHLGDGEVFQIGKVRLDSKHTFHRFKLKDIQYWSLESPTLYTLEIMDSDGNMMKQERIGFREIELKSEGVFLNGEKIKICGLNRHQSYPYVGYAMPAAPQRLDADILKDELGVNAVRTSHYPQSHHFINRCDELGLLVFMEIPGWQHIGDEAWKAVALDQVREMVVQYRNHPSIFIWGVRINESVDDHDFYTATNEIARELDPSRATGGVRYIGKSELLEDVYTYNDFSHTGDNSGLDPKSKITSNPSKPYMVTEYNGHMFPTKSFDDERHRLEHALRHAAVLDDLFKSEDIIGGYGWCMFDYNTHKDFGSGDRICYHGVMDMFRNPKMAASIYASQQDSEPVLEISSNMEVGEYPGSFRGDVYAFTNADQVDVYKNDRFIRSFSPDETPYKNMPHGPILINDFIGDLLDKDIKTLLMAVSKYGPSNLPFKYKILAAKVMFVHRISFEDLSKLYTKYIGDWGQAATKYRFEAKKAGEVVKTVEKGAMKSVLYEVDVDHTDLKELETYDVATIRIKAMSDLGNVLPYYQEAISFEIEGPIELIGPKVGVFRGGMTGTYVKTTGHRGEASLKVYQGDYLRAVIEFTCEIERAE